MTKAAIIRCEKNEEKCPLTNCLKCLLETKEGFERYSECMPAGVFTCRCPGDNASNLAKILKSKGAEVIHFCTCTFANKTDIGWDSSNGGFCENLDEIIGRVNKESGLPCVKGTAHLPKDYTLEILE
jgi:predicted metal-binding protein